MSLLEMILLQYKRCIVALNKTKVAGMFAAQSIG